MSRDKTLAVVGVSDAEAAHLRLLLRKNAHALDEAWRWGDETGADLIIVDPAAFSGQMARTRAQAAGVRCAVFSDEPVADADLVLSRPLTGANVVEVLNQAARPLVQRADIGTHGEDFYTRDLGETAPVAGHEPDSAPAAGLDALLRPEPMELRADPIPTSRRDPIAAAPPVAMDIEIAAIPADHAQARKYSTRAGMLADTTPRDLHSYLVEDPLNAPARFELPGVVPLVLDPKNRVAYGASSLHTLEPYCRARWRPCDWQPMTSSELAELRESQHAHAYTRLLWLHALVHSDGRLASHLDPGGTYRLKHWLEIDKDFGRYFRIASVLLQPARLHEIAAASEAPMADVFDLVNAYDAIGLIEWQPRRPREADPPAPGLLQRLRKPFGR